MRLLTAALFALLAVFSGRLLVGDGSVFAVRRVHAQLDQQLADNAAARERNAHLQAEVGDLKEGLEMVEEKARSELGMLKPDEILVQVAAQR